MVGYFQLTKLNSVTLSGSTKKTDSFATYCECSRSGSEGLFEHVSRAPALRMTDNEVMSSRNQAGSSASSSTSSSRSLSLGVENQTSSCYHGGGNNSIRSIDRNSSRIIDQDLHEETDSIEAASKGHSADDEDEEEIEEADLQEGFSSATSSPVKLPLQPCKPPSSSNNSRGGGGTQQQPHQVGDDVNKKLLALSALINFLFMKNQLESFVS